MHKAAKVAVVLPFFLLGTGLVVAHRFKSNNLPNVKQADGAVTLPNGWQLTPAGRAVKLQGDFPLKLLLSQDGKKLVALTAGHHGHGLTLIDLTSEQIVSSVDLAADWGGVDWAGADQLVVG